jgi:hypothetical protein
MAEGKEEEEKFDFTSEGEELGYISLDQAILLARQQAQEDGERHRLRLDWDEIVWSEVSSEQREDTFRIVLQFRRPGRVVLEEQTGEEEFIFNQLGALVFRQVLAWPEGGEPQEELSPPIPTSQIDDEDVARSPSDAGSLEDPTRKDDDDPLGDEDGDQEPSPEDVEYISLGDARVMAIRHARENPEIYGAEYQDTTMVWEPVSESEEEEFYDIKLSFRPAGTFTGTPGLEQFVISKTGDIELRQVLESPGSSTTGGGMPKGLLFGGLGAAVIAVIAIIVAMAAVGSGGDETLGEQIQAGFNDAPELSAPVLALIPTYTPYPTPITLPTPTARIIVVTPTFSPLLNSVSLANAPIAPIAPKTVITIDPSESTHGTLINWSASGFSSDSPIIVTYGPEYHRVATGISNATGSASGTFRIPSDSDAPSSNTVEVTDNSGNTASSLHKIPIPTISSSSSVAPAGSTIIVTGRYFPIERDLSDITIGGIFANSKPKAPLTNSLGEFEIELWIPHQSKGIKSLEITVQDDTQIISAETTLEITRRLPLTITLDSNQGIRNSSVKWDVERSLANSPLTIMYGSQRTIVATSTSNEFGEASGAFLVPGDSSIPSNNLVSAVEVSGSSASTPHLVPAAIIDMEWSRVTAGSSIELVGKYFPQSASIIVADIGSISVLPNPNPITDLNGNFRLNVLAPQQPPGEKSVVIQVGTGTNAVSARVNLIVEAADPISVGWEEVSLNGERWEETGRSRDCPEGECLRASNIPNGSVAEMNLILLNKSSSRFSPYMERTTISFEIKTSTESCCDILRVKHDGSISGSWSGNTDWQQVQFELSSARPTMIQWIYQKDDGITSGDDSVWVRNIQMK